MTERPIPHSEAYPLKARRADTLRFIEFMAEVGGLHRLRPAHIANTYRGMTEFEVEAEMMRHLPEGGDK